MYERQRITEKHVIFLNLVTAAIALNSQLSCVCVCVYVCVCICVCMRAVTVCAKLMYERCYLNTQNTL